MMNEPAEHVTKTEARAASKSRLSRNVLLISLLAIVPIFALILFVAR